jgi:hypothetical protein
MSDEPKKPQWWSRPWALIAWAALVVFVLYPLSRGPLTWIYLRTVPGTASHRAIERFSVIYNPLMQLRQHSELADGVLHEYEDWWYGL